MLEENVTHTHTLLSLAAFVPSFSGTARTLGEFMGASLRTHETSASVLRRPRRHLNSDVPSSNVGVASVIDVGGAHAPVNKKWGKRAEKWGKRAANQKAGFFFGGKIDQSEGSKF